MKKLNSKEKTNAIALLKFREIFIKTELNQNKAKAHLEIYNSLFSKLSDTKKAHKDLKIILQKNKDNADIELANVSNNKKYLRSAISILQNKLLK